MSLLAAAFGRRAQELCHRFMAVFGQTVKLVSLYNIGHPVPVSSMQEAWHLLHDLLTEAGWAEATLGLSAGRWIINEQVVADSAQAHELLALVFRGHAIRSIVFGAECRLYEFATLCELAATPPNRAYETDANEFLRERGVVHIGINIEEYVSSRRVQPPASALVQSPLSELAARLRARAPRPGPAQAAPPPAPPPGPAPAAQGGQSFGAFIKSLVERSVEDPRQRARIYAEAVRTVEQAVAQHVSAATHRLLLEKQGLLNERLRAEHVLGSVAEGRVVVDQEGRVLMMDSAAEGILGRPLAELAGKPLLEAAPGGERFVSLAKELVLPENRPVSEEVSIAGGPEALGAFRQSLAVVQDEQGRVVGTYGLLPHAAKYQETRRLQDEFMANVTHDLKAPLAALCSALELLRERLAAGLSPEDSEFLEISVRNSQSLRQLLDEILDFSRLEAGRMAVHPEPCRPEALLRESLRGLTPWARSRRISVELALEDPAGLPAVLADRGRIIQVLNNLLSNAIKFTPEGGHIALSAAQGQGRRAESVVFSVKDTGCGIPLPEQGRIFERFSQARSGAERQGGVGLGLSIAKELVTLHQGDIWLENAPGQGATFFFSLPAAR